MAGETIIYEQPLNERMRIFLRLEYLLKRARDNVERDSPWTARQVLDALIRIQDVVWRVDVKQDLIKALERIHKHTERIGQSPDADEKRVKKVLHDLKQSLDALLSDRGQLGYSLKHVELFNTLRHNALIAGGDSGFEQPYLHYWLNLSLEKRREDLRSWLKPFEVIEQAISLVLWLTRAGSEPKTITAQKGFFHQSLNRAAQYQLARVAVPHNADYFVTMSGNPLHINLRFMQAQSDLSRATPVENDVEFQLTLCPGNL